MEARARTLVSVVLPGVGMSECVCAVTCSCDMAHSHGSLRTNSCVGTAWYVEYVPFV